MNLDDCLAAIKASKKYRAICDETIRRLVAGESRKYRTEKELIKSVKTQLHQISGVFIDEGSIKRASGLLDGLSGPPTEETIREILSLHTSSRERLGFIEEMYGDIFAVTGSGGAILDLACGFNPFFLPLMPTVSPAKYYATDINVHLIALINEFFAQTGINGHACASDVLFKVPDIEAQNVLLLKIVPLLEQQQKGFAKTLIGQLKSEFFTLTFPTKSLSGKNVGMYQFYDRFMQENFAKKDFEYCLQKENHNEIIYVIRRVGYHLF